VEDPRIQEMLDHCPVGLAVYDGEGYLRYLNHQVRRLFALPEALAQPGVHAVQLLHFQVRRGDFGEAKSAEWITQALAELLLKHADSDHYERQFSSGVVVEIHRQRLSNGLIAGVYQDVSQRCRTRDALAQERQLLRTTLDLMPCGIVVSDQDLRYLLFNDLVPQLFDFPVGLMREGGSFQDGIGYQAHRGDFGEGDPETITEARLERLRTANEDSTFLRTLPSGQVVEIHRRFLGDGRTITIYIDVSESIRVAQALGEAQAQLEQTLKALKLTHQQLQQQACSDALTGAWNRRYFVERASAEVARYGRGGHSFGLIMLDVDHFKAVNDDFGHSEGDRVLVALVEILQQVLRTADLLCRLGGEEFAVLLPDTQLAGVVQLAERMRQCASQLLLPDGRVVTVILGVAVFRAEDENIDGLLRRTDHALYQAKHQGRNRLAVAHPCHS